MTKKNPIRSCVFLAFLLVVMTVSCKNIAQKPKVFRPDDYSYFTDTETCTCRNYMGLIPPPPPPEHPDRSDSIFTGNQYKHYMLHASITRCEETDLVRGNEYEVYQLKAWDFSDKTDVRIVSPVPQMCYITLELKRDSLHDAILIGYTSAHKFYSCYSLYVNDTDNEKMIKTDPAFTKGVVWGNISLVYKKQILPAQE